MSWLDALSKQARYAMEPAQTRRSEKPKRKPRPEVHLVTVTVSAPYAGSGGEIAEGYYTEVLGLLTMTDEKGHPVAKSSSATSHVLALGDNARSIAGMLLRRSIAKSDFNRRLTYAPGGNV